MSTFLVTGSTVVGNYLIRLLLERGHRCGASLDPEVVRLYTVRMASFGYRFR
jgi:hypothetical protein